MEITVRVSIELCVRDLQNTSQKILLSVKFFGVSQGMWDFAPLDNIPVGLFITYSSLHVC
jgi:hypothetical protein